MTTEAARGALESVSWRRMGCRDAMTVEHRFEDSSIAALRRAARAAPMLDAETEREHLRRIQEEHDEHALMALLAAHTRLVIAIASRYVRSGLSVADLVSEGNVGLLEAVRRFDRSRDVRFSTYATWWIRSRIRAFALDNRRIVAQPSTRGARKLLARIAQVERTLAQRDQATPAATDIAATSGASLIDVELVQAALASRDSPLACEHSSGVDVPADTPDAEDEIADRELARTWHERIATVIEQLDERERIVIHERFLTDDARTLSSIGHDLGISRERVRQIEKAAVGKLRAALDDLVRDGLV